MPETLADQVKRARAEAGMTQFEAATAAQISLTALRNIEQGITDDPRMSTVTRLFAALAEAKQSRHEQDGDTSARVNGGGAADSHEPDTAAVKGSAGLAREGA